MDPSIKFKNLSILTPQKVSGVNTPELKNKPELKTQKDSFEKKSVRKAETDGKFTWKEAGRNAVKGFIGQGVAVVKALVQNPIASITAIGATLAVVAAAPLVGISAAAMGMVIGTVFTAAAFGKTVYGIGKAAYNYAKGNKDQAEKDFKTIGEGAFDAASTLAPIAANKTFTIMKNSNLGAIVRNSEAYGRISNFANGAKGLMSAPSVMLKNATSWVTGKLAPVLEPAASAYKKGVSSQFAQNMSKSLPAKAVNGFYDNVVDFNEYATVKGIELANEVADVIEPKTIIVSDNHGKLIGLRAMLEKQIKTKHIRQFVNGVRKLFDPNFKPKPVMVFNGDGISKGPHPITGETSSSRDVMKFFNNELDGLPVQKNLGNHELQYKSTMENIHNTTPKETGRAERCAKAKEQGKIREVQTKSGGKTQFIDDGEVGELAKTARQKVRNRDDVLKKPSTSFAKEILEKYGITGDEELGRKVAEKLVKYFEAKLPRLNSGMKIPDGQIDIANFVLKQAKDADAAAKLGVEVGQWAINPKAQKMDPEFIKELAGKEFYRFFSNYGANTDEAVKGFARFYGLVSDNNAAQKIAARIVKNCEENLAVLNKHGELPKELEHFKDIIFNKENGKWVIKKEARDLNADIARLITDQEFNRYYDSTKLTLFDRVFNRYKNSSDKALATFARVNGVEDNFSALRKMNLGLKEFNQDFNKYTNNMGVFTIIDGKGKGEVLVDHGPPGYRVDENGSTILDAGLVFDSQDRINNGQFTKELMEKEKSIIYGGEGKKNADPKKDLSRFSMDRDDFTTEKLKQFHEDFSREYNARTGEDVNITRQVMGHETRSNGLLDPDTGLNPEYLHYLENVDGVKTTKDENGNVKITRGKEILQRRVISSHEGRLIDNDSGLGNAHDNNIGLTQAGEELIFTPGKGMEVKKADGSTRPAERFRHGAGVQMEYDGSLRDVYVRYDKKNKQAYKAKPGDYIFDAKKYKSYTDAIETEINSKPQLRQKLEKLLSDYNSHTGRTANMDDMIDYMAFQLQQHGKAESKVKDVISKLCPDQFYEVEIVKPEDVIEQFARLDKLEPESPILIRTKVKLPPAKELDTTLDFILNNAKKQSNGISLHHIQKTGDDRLTLQLGNGSDHRSALKAEIILEKADIPSSQAVPGNVIGALNKSVKKEEET